MRSHIGFVLGLLLAATVSKWAAPAIAQQAVVAFGTSSGTAVPLAVNASGHVLVTSN